MLRAHAGEDAIAELKIIADPLRRERCCHTPFVVRHAARFELKDALFQAAEPRAEPPAACRRSRC
jgi:hypothetical protein